LTLRRAPAYPQLVVFREEIGDVQLRDARVALVHHWLVTYRGGEKVLESLCRLFPDAELFTLVHDPRQLPASLNERRIHVSPLQRIPGATRRYKGLLPLMPLASEQLDLRGFDLVISSDASVVKGVLTRADQLHVCYCHSPPRYAWDLAHDYVDGDGALARARALAASAVMHYVRMFDARAAQGVDDFVANSSVVARRIRKHYRRDAAVIHPPVSVERFGPAPDRVGDHYLFAGQLVAYKRPDLAVDAFAALDRPLRVVGEGAMVDALRRRAPDNVTFVGRVDDTRWADEMARCRALIFPGEEDFGIVPVEAMAAGRPVIALGRGGALESVRGPVVDGMDPTPADLEGATGLFFPRDDARSLADAVRAFERVADAFDPATCRARAETFAEPRFRQRLGDHLDRVFADHAAPLR